MSHRVGVVDPGRLARWCLEHLGSPPVHELFRSGQLSAVIALRLADNREVVVKVRPNSPRIAACVEVQRRLFEAGFPCPRPLTDAAAFGRDIATAEAYVPGGASLPSGDRVANAFAEAFARLIRLAPRPNEVSTLDPAPSWVAWNHTEDGLWPSPEDLDVNLNEVTGAEWIDDAGRRARDRLTAMATNRLAVEGRGTPPTTVGMSSTAASSSAVTVENSADAKPTRTASLSTITLSQSCTTSSSSPFQHRFPASQSQWPITIPDSFT